MPPISWTSKWRWPSVRSAASRTVAKAGDKQFVEGLAGGELLRETSRVLARKLRVGQGLRNLGLQRVDRRDLRLIALQAAVVGRAENLPGDGAEHARTFLTGPSPVYGAGAVSSKPLRTGVF